MGYCYDSGSRLICDCCGSSRGVSKRPCAFDYCQPTAMCADCRAKYPDSAWTDLHRKHGCDVAHAEYVEKQLERRRLLDAGKAVRCSALGVGDNTVHVLFEKADGSTVGHYMSSKTYDAFPLLANTTPEDYAAHGEVLDAPPEFAFGGTSKQVLIA